MTGTWETKKGALNRKVIGTFNSEGQLDGPYKEYFWSRLKMEEIVRWEGQFGIVSVKLFDFDIDSKKYFPRKRQLSQRTGGWTEYGQDGEPLQQIQYNWQF